MDEENDVDETSQIRSTMHVPPGTPLVKKNGEITFMPSQKYSALTFVVSVAVLVLVALIWSNTRNNSTADIGNKIEESLTLQRTLDQDIKKVSGSVVDLNSNLATMVVNDKSMVAAMGDLSKAVNSGVKTVQTDVRGVRSDIKDVSANIGKLRHNIAHVQGNLERMAEAQPGSGSDEAVVQLSVEEEPSAN